MSVHFDGQNTGFLGYFRGAGQIVVAQQSAVKLLNLCVKFDP